MAKITLHGNPFNTCGELPEVGAVARFRRTDTPGEVDFPGDGAVVLNIFPSVDTPVSCRVREQFNEKAAALKNTTVLCISMDLPFALDRFCGAEGIENVKSLSAFRHPEFGAAYGVTITDGPLAGLFARAVVVIDANNVIVHSQLVPEIAQEPDYAAALKDLAG